MTLSKQFIKLEWVRKSVMSIHLLHESFKSGKAVIKCEFLFKFYVSTVMLTSVPKCTVSAEPMSDPAR